MRTGNPGLKEKTFENFGVYRRDHASDQSLTGGSLGYLRHPVSHQR